MAYKIAASFPDLIPKRRPEKRKDYLAFVRELPSCVSGRTGVQAAHTSFANPWFGHFGRGKGTKAPDLFALPLTPEEHAESHSMNEIEWWDRQGIDPHMTALTLWAIYSMYDYHDAVERCTARIMQGIRRNGERRQEYAQG